VCLKWRVPVSGFSFTANVWCWYRKSNKEGGVPVSGVLLSPVPTTHHTTTTTPTNPLDMQETEEWDGNGRRGIHRTWRNTRGELHRTTGPAVEEWTVLPGGAHVLSYQVWHVNGKLHREGRPAVRWWDVANDGTRVLARQAWRRHEQWHRVGGPSYRNWTVGSDGTRTLRWEAWRVYGRRHRVDGPTQAGDEFDWHDRRVRQEDLPWLRRGRDLLVGLHAWRRSGDQSQSRSPAWIRDPRVAMTGYDGAAAAASAATYRSFIGGALVMCV